MKQAFANHPVDNSAWIHLAVHTEQHSNVFRLEAHLRSGVRPAKLQQAVDVVAAQFPMLTAGIRKWKNTCVVVPCPERLNIRADVQWLAYMSMEELHDCAMRVLYGSHRIAVEFFHSLTDGAGGLQFLKALLAEYLDVPLELVPEKEAWEDSYRRYAAGPLTRMPGGTSYLLPAAPLENAALNRTTLTFSVRELRQNAAVRQTTLTTFFAALFAQTAMEMQRSETTPDKTLLPVQIMVPIDLRKRFPSRSLRNFSLYALSKLVPSVAQMPFAEIVKSMATQIQEQSTYAHLRSAMATNVALERRTALLPLWMKCAALKTGFEVCGGRSSCITVSNLGQVVFPDAVQQEIKRLDFLLTPRAHSPYNCSIASVGDVLSLTITRRGKERGLEKKIVAHLARLGIAPDVVETFDF